MKHTPGRWTKQDGFLTIYTISDHATNAIAHVLHRGNSNGSAVTREEAEANANLIASAPDLLAACKEAMFAWAHGVGSVTTSDDPDVRANADRNTREGKRIMRLIADAIAKAEGGAG